MKLYIKSSAGDITLYKFILVPMDRISGIDESNYDERLNGYFYLWSYKYNTITKYTEDRMYSHSDVIDSLPTEIRKQARELTIWGKTDYFCNRGIRFVIVNEEYLNIDQIYLIKQYCKER